MTFIKTPRSRGTKVFIVDDDDAVRDSMKVPLAVHGFEVETCGSTADFAHRYCRPAQGCLILDQDLPMTTGLEFLRSAAGKALGIPVILITGQGDSQLE